MEARTILSKPSCSVIHSLEGLGRAQTGCELIDKLEQSSLRLLWGRLIGQSRYKLISKCRYHASTGLVDTKAAISVSSRFKPGGSNQSC